MYLNNWCNVGASSIFIAWIGSYFGEQILHREGRKNGLSYSSRLFQVEDSFILHLRSCVCYFSNFQLCFLKMFKTYILSFWRMIETGIWICILRDIWRLFTSSTSPQRGGLIDCACLFLINQLNVFCSVEQSLLVERKKFKPNYLGPVIF